MTITRMPIKDIDLSVIYTTLAELARETGISLPGLRKYLDVIDGFIIDRKHEDGQAKRGKNVYLTPASVDQFKGLIKVGIIRSKQGRGKAK